MNELGVQQRFRDGMFWVRVDDGDEFEVNPQRWNDPGERAAIIALERKGVLNPQD
ncbi:hypothetical protein [Mycolicibacterium mengxianglii]|uniref:hypothetical protein n=1 Tax=Mycolicibacterium mengxianglii TaxID=2736649 RepID=UPI0018D06F65|nr:hypothetical protein [Mycolicibacterium mengxianglii]